jgi:hypothetical protein
VEVLLVLLELHDLILSAPQSAKHLQVGCEKVIRHVSTGGDWPGVALDVTIVRRPPLCRGSDNWFAKVSSGVRAELLNLGGREISFSDMHAQSRTDSGLSDHELGFEAAGGEL